MKANFASPPDYEEDLDCRVHIGAEMKIRDVQRQWRLWLTKLYSERIDIYHPMHQMVGPYIDPTLIEDHHLMIPLYMTKTQKKKKKRLQGVKSTMNGMTIEDA